MRNAYPFLVKWKRWIKSMAAAWAALGLVRFGATFLAPDEETLNLWTVRRIEERERVTDDARRLADDVAAAAAFARQTRLGGRPVISVAAPATFWRVKRNGGRDRQTTSTSAPHNSQCVVSRPFQRNEKAAIPFSFMSVMNSRRNVKAHSFRTIETGIAKKAKPITGCY